MVFGDQQNDPSTVSIINLVITTLISPALVGIGWLIKRLFDKIEKLEDKNQALVDDNAVTKGKLMAAEMRLALRQAGVTEEIDAVKTATGTSEAVDKILQDRKEVAAAEEIANANKIVSNKKKDGC